MFDKLLQELRDMERTKVSVPIKVDKDGYIDKECPNKECLFHFKVDQEDWKNHFKDEKVFCPMCRHEAPSDSWWTTEQLEDAKEQAKKHIMGRIGEAIREDAESFNASQPRNSFIKMSLKVTSSSSPHYILPVPATEEMTLKIKCQECNSKYAVIGSAFFCPCCGHNSVDETLNNSLAKIHTKLDNLSVIRKAVEAVSKDDAEITCRSLIESSLNEIVVAFQRFCELTFGKIKPDVKVKFNAFQNLDAGGEYWKNVYGESYPDWLTKNEFREINELFQKRHLLSHTEGIVDQKYLDRSGDSTYKIGQRIVVKETDIKNLIKIVQKLVDKLRQKGSS
jgi:hypothetical protein